MVMDQIEMQLSAKRAVGQAQLMAKEIDHRVMNSLQFVSGLLRMQSRLPAADGGAAHLQLAANRVAAVAKCIVILLATLQTKPLASTFFVGCAATSQQYWIGPLLSAVTRASANDLELIDRAASSMSW